MLTVLLWITLTASAILLIAIASPIRLSCKAVYREDGHNTIFNASAHYPHPLILRAEYSSTDNRVKFFILGFEKKQGDDQDDNDGMNTEDVDMEDINTNGIDTEDINAEEVNADNINTNGINNEDVNTDDTDKKGTNTENINTDDISKKTINTEDGNARNSADAKKNYDIKEKISSGISKINSYINAIKRNRVYKIISNKPLREKLSRWLKRSSVRAMRIVSFEKLKLHARFGIHDPATLGKIYGYFSATKSALTLRDYHIDLNMEPVFMEKCLDIDAELKIKTTLSTILWHLTIIAVTFPYLRLRKVIKKGKNSEAM